ncbi:MAG: hypothetical protein R6X33_15070 [Candidatus Brocadiia bacterium]
MKALRKVGERALRRGESFLLRSTLGPVDVQLQTDDYRLYQFWHENWYVAKGRPGPPAGRVTVARGVEQEQPGAYYCRRTGDVLFLACNSYMLCRDWTLGLAADLAARQSCIGLSAATFATEAGVVLVMAENVRLLAAFALQAAVGVGVRVQNVTWTWLEPAEEGVQAARAERSFLVPGACVTYDRGLLDLMAGSHLHENVLERKDGCINLTCLRRVDAGEAQCGFDLGHDKCYLSRPNSAVLLHEGMLPRSVPPEETLSISRMLLVREGDQAEPELKQMDSSEFVASARKGVGPQACAWCTPQLLQPADEIYDKVLGRAASRAQTAALTVPREGLQEACRMVFEWCKTPCEAHAG